MKDSSSVTRPKGRLSKIQIASYVLDWVICIIAAAIGTILGEIDPRKRDFALDDPNISFPFTTEETVDSKLLLVCVGAIPVAIILVVTLIFVPGPTVPQGTPQSLIWKRKLWELHVGWLGLAASLAGAWFITSSMKNLFGKPRPDMLDRCDPDIENFVHHLAVKSWNGVRGLNGTYNGQLVTAAICKATDPNKDLADGFRSYPSGHSSSSAAGLIYTSFFLASKFNITIPFVTTDVSGDKAAATAFPSRLRNDNDFDNELAYSNDPAVFKRLADHNATVAAARKQAAAPPLYLVFISAFPFFLSIFIAGSRWSDYRHHGFDILFGFIIGLIMAWFTFRLYHLPLRSGAGWAWGPRSRDKAFWAGLGSYSYATDNQDWTKPGDEEERLRALNVNNSSGIELGGMRNRAGVPHDYAGYESTVTGGGGNGHHPYQPTGVEDGRRSP